MFVCVFIVRACQNYLKQRDVVWLARASLPTYLRYAGHSEGLWDEFGNRWGGRGCDSGGGLDAGGDASALGEKHEGW